MRNKLLGIAAVITGMVLATACGVAPTDPSALPETSAAKAPAAAAAATPSGGGAAIFSPPTTCLVAEPLALELAERGEGYLIVASNYDPNARGCKPLKRSVDPSDVKFESFVDGTERLIVWIDASGKPGYLVSADSSDGDHAELYIESWRTAADALLPPPVPPYECGLEAVELAVVDRGDKSVTVEASYKAAGPPCPAPRWSVSPYAPHELADKLGMQLVVFDDGTIKQDTLYVTATVQTPTGDLSATLPIQFAGSSGKE